MQINMFQAKTHLSGLVARALQGEEVVIAKNGEPLVKLAPVVKPRGLTGFGSLKVKKLDAAFSAEVDAEIAAGFYGEASSQEVCKVVERGAYYQPKE